jgi:hypothetical protein
MIMKKRGRPAKKIDVTVIPQGMAKPVTVGLVVQAVETHVGSASNYGANENRRTCHACQSVNSRIDTIRRLAKMIIRYRVCRDCGRRRTTQEIVSA